MKKQAGGTIFGLVIGIVVGLGIALGVAAYITKVPIPFVDKGQSRTPEQDAAELEKNKTWDPNLPLSGKAVVTPQVAPPAVPNEPTERAKPPVSADPLGDLVKSRAAKTTDDLVYFVQVGAYHSADDADSQRAKLALSGLEVKVFEGAQSGRKVFRVRVGPFDKKADAEKTRNRLITNGLETALVRVPR